MQSLLVVRPEKEKGIDWLIHSVVLVDCFIKVTSVFDVKNGFIEIVFGLPRGSFVRSFVMMRKRQRFLRLASIERMRSFDRGSIELPRAFSNAANHSEFEGAAATLSTSNRSLQIDFMRFTITTERSTIRTADRLEVVCRNDTSM